MNKLPGVMIRAGLVLLVFGIFRRTTVDTGWGEIHNIGLMQQQTNLILLGAVIFIGGLILKTKRPDDSLIPKDDDVAKNPEILQKRLNESKRKVAETSQELSALSTRVLERMNAFRDRFFLRLGLAFGISILLIGSSLLYALLVPVTFLLLLILSMRCIGAYSAIGKMFFVALCLSVLGLMVTVVLAMEGSAGDVNYITHLLFSLMINVVLILGYLRFKRISN